DALEEDLSAQVHLHEGELSEPGARGAFLVGRWLRARRSADGGGASRGSAEERLHLGAELREGVPALGGRVSGLDSRRLGSRSAGGLGARRRKSARGSCPPRSPRGGR